MIHKLTCTGLSPSMITFSNVFHFIYYINIAVLLPRYCRNNNGLGLSPVARRYWGNHVCFLLLQVLRCFSSLRLPTLRYNMSSTYWVIPFGDLRIKGYLHLNGAFRSLSRPSSPLRAQASTIRPSLFTLIIYFKLTRKLLMPHDFKQFPLLLIVVVYIFYIFPVCQRTASLRTVWRIRESNP